jgi:signal transduction histidine kinase
VTSAALIDEALQRKHPGMSALVRDALRELRFRNALVIGWARVALSVVLLSTFAFATFATPDRFAQGGVAFNGVFLAAAAATLLLLLRREWTSRVILGAQLLDAVHVALVAWRGMTYLPAPYRGVGLGLLLAGCELLLFTSALVLPARQLALFSLISFVGATGWILTTSMVPGLPPGFVIALGAFGIAVIWAGRRVVGHGLTRSLETWSGRLLDAHRIELDAVSRALADANDAKRASHAKAEMLTQLVLHDLKNPISILLANVETVHDRLRHLPEFAEETDELQIAGAEARRLSGMIGDLLLASRLEQGELEPHRAPVHVRELADSVARGMAALANSRHVHLEVSASPGLEAQLDVGLLRRLLENLVANALRFTEPGNRIQIAAAERDQLLLLAVRNDGPAISPEVRSRLFQEQRSHGRSEWHNVGLGLHLCRLVAESHGGTIGLGDEAGWSVSFEARIPLR